MPTNAGEETGEAIDARTALVEWAAGEIGERDPNVYYRVCAPQFADKGAEHSVSWCGIFCLAGLHAVAPTRAPMWKTGKGFVFELRVVPFPERGDIAVFRKGADGRDIWHHAIVEHVASGRVYTIDGNVMPAPKEGVARRVRPIDSNVTFYSIASLLRDP